MRKIFSFIAMASLWSPIYADAITDGISNAGDAAYSYTPYVQAIAFVLACVMGIVGAFVIYYANALHGHRPPRVLWLSGRTW